VDGRGRNVVMYTKGAPEVVLAQCTAEQRNDAQHPLDDGRRAETLAAAQQMAGQALRVLALACREFPPGTTPDQFVERELVFAGLAGMIDPPRAEVKAAIATCRSAGIRPVMITGDHPTTAAAVAAELGLATDPSQTIEGRALDQMDDQALVDRVAGLAVYARVSPEHKLRVVRAWQKLGEVVAMTGDGVNDAPAVKAADIGVAMGRTGTDVTKEASAMVLIDDNFTSIVNAVEEGRGIFDNIQKFIHYLLSCNAGEVMLMFAAALAGWPAPLEAIQILWINLVTDGLPALALGLEAPERDVMQRPPRPPREPVITLRRGLRIVRHGGLIALASGAGFALVLDDGLEHSLERARTVAFCVMAYSQLFFSVSCRSATRTLPELGPFTNLPLVGAIAVSGLVQLAVVTLPFAQGVFETVSNLSYEWVVIAVLALLPVTVVETTKLLRAFLGRRA
jgi:Ca2+-transporting ATPase